MNNPEDERDPRTEGINVILKGFGIVMVILYIALGITIIFKAVDIGHIPQNYARIFGAILVLYGVFRGYKIYRRYFSRSDS